MTTVITDIFSVFTEILTWLIRSIESASTLFWSSEGLTLFGGIAVIGVGIAIILMVIAIIRSLIRFQ